MKGVSSKRKKDSSGRCCRGGRWTLLLTTVAIATVTLAAEQECVADGSCQEATQAPARSSNASSGTQTDLSSSSLSSSSSCRLYLAESTIPGAGLGIFTAVEQQVGDTVGEGDICIPLIDLYWCVVGVFPK